MRRLQKQSSGRDLVLADTLAVELCDREFDHGIEIAGDRSLLHEPHRLVLVFLYASTLLVHGGERILRLRIAAFRRGCE